MTISINTKDAGETTIHIIAATIAEAIQKLDRARAALWELHPETPRTAPPLGTVTNGIPNAQAVDQMIAALAPVADNTDAHASTPPPPVDIPLDVVHEVGAQHNQGQEQTLPSGDSPSAANDQTPTAEELRPEIAAIGLRLFGEDWSRAHAWLINLWTTKYTPTNVRNSADLLDAEECSAILQGMIDHATETKAEWHKHLQHEAAKVQSTQRPQPVQRRANGRQPRAVPPPTPAQVAAANDPVYATG